ncbi:MAG: polysaccharide deacetylase family protein [Eubacteriales bacterium]|nr:polysaccharide deacetylase family protein [Eubacteriales bacterium]
MKNPFKRFVCAALACGLLGGAAGATDWGLSYRNGANMPPSGEDTAETLARYGAYYMGGAADKTIYLTFDCGYENGNTAKILDTLKRRHVPAVFFVVGHYLDAAPALAKRMGDEGHLVGSHSVNHPNMTKVSQERFESELRGLETKYAAVTGRRLAPFFRPPEGSYTYDNLRWAQSLGYHTTLWSVAYKDYDVNDQPSYASAMQTLDARVHNGAIVLLHAISSTDAAVLDELITDWKAKGYEFAALSALPGLPNPTVTAVPNAAAFTVDGAPAAPTAFLIGGSNYVKLRDAAQALAGTEKAFSVSYDKASDSVALVSGEVYAPNGAELAGPRDAAAVQAYASPQTITLDGAPLGVDAYSIDGANYVGLRDLARALDCCVTYDRETQAVGLDTSRSYADAQSAPTD